MQKTLNTATRSQLRSMVKPQQHTRKHHELAHMGSNGPHTNFHENTGICMFRNN